MVPLMAWRAMLVPPPSLQPSVMERLLHTSPHARHLRFSISFLFSQQPCENSSLFKKEKAMAPTGGMPYAKLPVATWRSQDPKSTPSCQTLCFLSYR